MFTPIKIQQYSSSASTPQPSSSSNHHAKNKHNLSTPVSVGSLSVMRLRQLIRDQNHQGDNTINNNNNNNNNNPASPLQHHQNISRRKNQDEKNHVILASSTNNVNNSHQFNIASDLSALAGGAPVAKLFLHMTTTPDNNNSNNHNNDEIETEEPNNVIPGENNSNYISPIRKPTSKLITRNSQSRARHHQNTTTTTSILDEEKAKILDDEFTLKLLAVQQQQQNQRSSTTSSSSSPSQKSLPLQVAMHCREMGMRITDALPLRSNTSTLLKRVIEVLVTFGEEQHAVALESQARCNALEGQLYEFRDAHREFEAQKRHKENLRLQKQKENSYQGLQDRYKQMSKVLQLNDDDDEEEKEDDNNQKEDEDEEDKTLSADAKDRKRMIKQLVNIQGLLAAEKEAVNQANLARDNLQIRLDIQIAQQEIRDKDQRELILQNSRRYDELDHKMGTKTGEIQALRSEIKELQSELDDKLWLGTVEVESSEVAMSMLRKHSKDMESRCAITLMRLRQEQELVTKLKRKLSDLGSSYQELLKRQNDREQQLNAVVQQQQQQMQLHVSTTESNSQQQISPATSPSKKSATTENVVVENHHNNPPPPPLSPTVSISSGAGALATTTTNIPASLLQVDPSILSLELHQDQLQVSRDLKDIEDTVKAVDAVGGGAVISSISTPRPDKEMIVRSVPSLGHAQIGLIPARKKSYDKDDKTGANQQNDDDDDDGDDSHQDLKNTNNGNKKVSSTSRAAKMAASASTASIVEALISIIKTQEERIKIESRSWETAQEEADKALEERKEKMKVEKVDVEVQVGL